MITVMYEKLYDIQYLMLIGCLMVHLFGFHMSCHWYGNQAQLLIPLTQHYCAVSMPSSSNSENAGTIGSGEEAA